MSMWITSYPRPSSPWSIFLVVALIWGQTRPTAAEPAPQITLKVGPNAATQAEENRFHRYGLSGGLAGQLVRPLGGRLSFGGQVELLYSPRGAEASLDGAPLGQIRLHYLDLIVAARLEVRFGAASAYAILGAAPSYLMSAIKEDSMGRESEITDDLKRVDVALLLGAGVALQLPQHELGPIHLSQACVELRHGRGLLDTVDVGDGRGFQNRSTAVMLGLSFGLGAALPKPATAVKEPAPATARTTE